MAAILFSLATFLFTMAGGWFCLRYKDKLNLLIAFTSGVLLGVVFFEVVPEIMSLTMAKGISPSGPMISLVLGFLFFHIIKKFILNHFTSKDKETIHEKPKHPKIGMLSALAMAGHSFMDGVAIGLGFQVSSSVGILVAIAVIAHDFTDGMNTVAVMLMHKNTSKSAWKFLTLDALTPILGAASTLLFKVPEGFLALYLGFFAGFLLYIGVTEMLPEAHKNNSSIKSVALTTFGLALIFLLSRFI